MSWFFLFIAVVLNSAGNILIKESAQTEAQGIVLYLSIPFVSGAFLFGMNLLAYTKAQTTIPLTVAYCIMVGASMLIISIYGYFVLKETINYIKISGMILILIGIYFVVRA